MIIKRERNIYDEMEDYAEQKFQEALLEFTIYSKDGLNIEVDATDSRYQYDPYFKVYKGPKKGYRRANKKERIRISMLWPGIVEHKTTDAGEWPLNKEDKDAIVAALNSDTKDGIKVWDAMLAKTVQQCNDLDDSFKEIPKPNYSDIGKFETKEEYLRFQSKETKR